MTTEELGLSYIDESTVDPATTLNADLDAIDAAVKAIRQAIADGVVSPEDLEEAINTALAGIDLAPYLKKDGSVDMTGLLKLSGDPTDDLHAATKRWVIAQIAAAIASGGGSVDLTPYIKSDGSRDFTANVKLPVTGPTDPQHAASKKYVDDSGAGYVKTDGSRAIPAVQKVNSLAGGYRTMPWSANIDVSFLSSWYSGDWHPFKQITKIDLGGDTTFSVSATPNPGDGFFRRAELLLNANGADRVLNFPNDWKPIGVITAAGATQTFTLGNGKLGRLIITATEADVYFEFLVVGSAPIDVMSLVRTDGTSIITGGQRALNYRYGFEVVAYAAAITYNMAAAGSKKTTLAGNASISLSNLPAAEDAHIRHITVLLEPGAADRVITVPNTWLIGGIVYTAGGGGSQFVIPANHKAKLAIEANPAGDVCLAVILF